MFLSSFDLVKDVNLISAVLYFWLQVIEHSKSHLLCQAFSCPEQVLCQQLFQGQKWNYNRKSVSEGICFILLWNFSVFCKSFYFVWCDVTMSLKLLFKMEKKSCKHLGAAKLTNDSFLLR